MGKYRKTALVEATQWFKRGDHKKVRDLNTEEVGRMALGKYTFKLPPAYDIHDVGAIDTLEGAHLVLPGDFIITGVEGEHYACKPHIFEKTYEKVEV